MSKDEYPDFAVVRWAEDFGRHGYIEGLMCLNRRGMALVAKAEEVGVTLSLGDALGKHSDVHVDLKLEQLTVLATGDDARTVARILCPGGSFDTLGRGHISGEDPLGVLSDMVKDGSLPHGDGPNPFGCWVQPAEWDSEAHKFVSAPLDPWDTEGR